MKYPTLKETIIASKDPNEKGTWTFDGWTPETATIDGKDIEIVGKWRFEEPNWNAKEITFHTPTGEEHKVTINSMDQELSLFDIAPSHEVKMLEGTRWERTLYVEFHIGYTTNKNYMNDPSIDGFALFTNIYEGKNFKPLDYRKNPKAMTAKDLFPNGLNGITDVYTVITKPSDLFSSITKNPPEINDELNDDTFKTLPEINQEYVQKEKEKDKNVVTAILNGETLSDDKIDINLVASMQFPKSVAFYSYYYLQEQIAGKLLYFDLHFNLDERTKYLKNDNPINLNFNSYSWAPQAIFMEKGGKKIDLSNEGETIVNPEKYQSLPEIEGTPYISSEGVTWYPGELSYPVLFEPDVVQNIQKDSPDTSFKFYPKEDTHQFIVRSVLRKDLKGSTKPYNDILGKEYAIPEATLEQIMQKVRLSAPDGPYIYANGDDAKAIALGKAQPLRFEGFIDGKMQPKNTGSLRSVENIPKNPAIPLEIKFRFPEVTFVEDGNHPTENIIDKIKVFKTVNNNKTEEGLQDQLIPKDPTNSGKTFAGWKYINPKTGKEENFDADTPVLTDITVYPSWKTSETPEKPEVEVPEKPHHSGGGGHSNYIPSQNGKLNMVDHYAYMFGYPEKDFRAERPMTRGEVAAMFSRLMKKYPEKGYYKVSNYNDVKTSDWFFEPVEYMRETGVISGYPDGTFRGNAFITRAEFATIAARFDKLTSNDRTFSDVAPDFWASKYISSAAAKDWVNGYPDGTFKPMRDISRAEVVTVTNHMLNREADEAFVNNNKAEILNFIDLQPSYWAYYDIVEATNGHDYERKANGHSEIWEKLNHKEFLYPVLNETNRYFKYQG